MNYGASTGGVDSGWSKYGLFMCRTSDGATMLIDPRQRTDDGSFSNTIRMTGSQDTGTNSYVFNASLIMSGNSTMKLVAASSHKINQSDIVTTKLQLKALYGLM